ncbi:unnamed protein product [Blepharisma stoltei]|uniref:Transmembrane protein n=1 Tax=Blepharisma stoltei TaxID=1481888 RepID=A0AAU9JDL8_9CILI|nr:unnamed protein product [Blepharisma stoltei]
MKRRLKYSKSIVFIGKQKSALLNYILAKFNNQEEKYIGSSLFLLKTIFFWFLIIVYTNYQLFQLIQYFFSKSYVFYYYLLNFWFFINSLQLKRIKCEDIDWVL